ncbi:MAG: exodeoxyribonuclease VII large subunit [Acidobacteria bacterium]|nr:exodeoxyribonuclease VII large subunit [Acidobacteriota bacterium]
MLSPYSEATYAVSALCAEVRDFLGEAFRSVWVVGEVQRVKQSQNGHLYFELVEKGEHDRIVAKLDAVIWRGDLVRVRRALASSRQQIAEGMQIRCRAGLDFWPPGGRMQLVVREVDPVFTLGLLEQRRRETLEHLARAGLLEANRVLPMPELPLVLGLVTSEGSAAYHDFLSSLEESGYGFRVVFVHAAVQGARAEREIASALAALAAAAVPLAVLIRGGGARSDLAAFDTRVVAEAVARAPFPVLTGLGHEIDESIADRVAHTAFKTPTKVAEHLVELVAEADAAVLDLKRRLRREALEPLLAAQRAVDRAERELRLAHGRLLATAARLDEYQRLFARLSRELLKSGGQRLDRVGGQIAGAAPRLLERAAARPRPLLDRMAVAARGRLAAARATADGLARVFETLSPERTLERGFSITRGADGTLIRRSEQVTAGQTITTQVSRGTITSRIEE